MQKLFVIGGDYHLKYDISCMFYDKRDDKWTSIAGTMEGRKNAACTVFEGKIVVSGGTKTIQASLRKLRNPPIIMQVNKDETISSVEVYDYHENKWSFFPFMLKPRSNHTAVSINNNLFIIGGYSRRIDVFNSFEVFDSVTRTFTSIKSPKWIEYVVSSRTACIGYKVYFFIGGQNKKVKVCSYDVKKRKFSFKTSFNLENTENFSCTKVSMY